jgi:predicted AAA+ superfamily ATPase
MKRFIEKQLEQWKESSRRKPLILRGLRQVGKTWTVKVFGNKCFEQIAVIDLERNPAWRKVFEGDLNARRICADLEVLTGQKIKPGKTLLFIDEIQSSPRAIAALRYFYEEMPDLHVIAAGSLLEFALKDISIPVGRVQFLQMYPLCFAEYLEAIGNEEAAAVVLAPPCQVSQTVHDFLITELRKYFFVGGMPESVQAYVDTGSLRESFEVHKELIETYRMDFAKYAPHADKLCLNSVFTTLSRNVGRQIKYAKLAEGYSNPTLKKAFELLCLAGVVRKIPSVNPAGLPLGASASPGIFKAIMADIGLMQSLAGMSVELEYARIDLLQVYRGAMAEQFVGQEMLISQKGQLYYWDRQAKSSMAEVDFLAEIEGIVHPVEVKSGASGSLKSLRLYLDSYANSGKAMVFSMRPFAKLPDTEITFLPLYFAMSATGGGLTVPT